ncbi:MAG: VanZ family protein [Bacilli bacterium]|nr:VanZ family protein [Bacilli bacterium]
MFRDALIEIVNETWPMIFIFCAVVLTLRISYIIKNKIKITIYKELLLLCFIIYILCLFYVVTFQDVSWSTSNLVPFKEMFRYEIGSKMFFKNVVGNMIMFIPYGFFAAYLLQIKKPFFILFLSCLVSFLIETTQYNIGRVFDVDDILLNIIGGFLGYLIYYFLTKLNNRLPKSLKNDLFYNILVVVIIFMVALYLLKVINIGL